MTTVDRVAHVIARFGAIVLLLAAAAAGGFAAGRATAPEPPPAAFTCSANSAPTATRVGDDVIVTQVC